MGLKRTLSIAKAPEQEDEEEELEKFKVCTSMYCLLLLAFRPLRQVMSW